MGLPLFCFVPHRYNCYGPCFIGGFPSLRSCEWLDLRTGQPPPLTIVPSSTVVAPSSPSSPLSPPPTLSSSIEDPDTDWTPAWLSLPSLPEPKRRATLFIYNNIVHCCGGELGSDVGIRRHIYTYCDGDASWSIADWLLPEPLDMATSHIFDNHYLWITGVPTERNFRDSQDGQGQHINGTRYPMTYIMDMRHPSTDSWIQYPEIPEPRQGLHTVLFNYHPLMMTITKSLS
jgi:hypothetical protein